MSRELRGEQIVEVSNSDMAAIRCFCDSPFIQPGKGEAIFLAVWAIGIRHNVEVAEFCLEEGIKGLW